MNLVDAIAALQKRLDEQDVPTPRCAWVSPDFYKQFLTPEERKDMDKVEAAIEKARNHLDEVALPANLTTDEAIQFYQAIAAHCDGAIDALESEEP